MARHYDAPFSLEVNIQQDKTAIWLAVIKGFITMHLFKGIFSDSKYIFLWHELKDINKKADFQNISWIQNYVIKLCMIMCVALLPLTSLLNKFSWLRISVQIALISYWNDFSPILLGSVLCSGELQKYAKKIKFWECPQFDIS